MLNKMKACRRQALTLLFRMLTLGLLLQLGEAFHTVLVDEAAQASELATLQAFAFGCKQCAVLSPACPLSLPFRTSGTGLYPMHPCAHLQLHAEHNFWVALCPLGPSAADNCTQRSLCAENTRQSTVTYSTHQNTSMCL